jgi:hypothetical protein
MSIPPVPPMPPEPLPEQPPRGTTTSSKKAKLQGALVATVVVVLISSVIGAVSVVSDRRASEALFLSPAVALGCVVLGSVLASFERPRQFATGFLIASAILIFVSAGVCTIVTLGSL